MKKIFVFIVIAVFFNACQSNKYEPVKVISEKDAHLIKMELSRFMDKLPSRTKMEDRWDTTLTSRNAYYSLKADSMKLLCFYEGKDGYKYFFITRIVPSIHEGDRRGSSGRFRWDSTTNRVSDLEEYLLTNIMQPAKIEEVAPSLFEITLEKDTLPENFANKDFIEWPNGYFAYDKKNHNWDRRVFFRVRPDSTSEK